ncbi:MAG: hypothetical protein PWQ89_1375 [Verrucomicrobiota bacterium]|nr:hypothetical protein [Verrucomicrobiota bacterium]
MKTATFSLLFILVFKLAAGAEMGNPEDIPEAGRIRIDGRLEDWRHVEWTPLTESLDGNPVNISNARWALQWDDDGMLYIAVRYDDADLVLQNGYTGPGRQDGVEIYVRGDTGSDPVDYSKLQDSAQHYIFGLSRDKATPWKKLAGMESFPAHNPATAVVKLEGSTFTYEIRVPLYDKFDAKSRRRTELSEPVADFEIGADIAITDVGSDGYAGMKSENKMGEKENNAEHIAVHTLSE